VVVRFRLPARQDRGWKWSLEEGVGDAEAVNGVDGVVGGGFRILVGGGVPDDDEVPAAVVLHNEHHLGEYCWLSR
jgi:hypothetical protein